MFGLFKKKSPLKHWEKEREALATKAFHAQRNGDIRLYSSLTAEAEALGEKIAALQGDRSNLRMTSVECAAPDYLYNASRPKQRSA